MIKRKTKNRVYIETSFVSYLTSQPNRDIIIAAHQQITHEWWELRRNHFELYISQIVIQEAEKGNKEAAAKRLKIINTMPLLEFKEEALELTKAYIQQKCLPKKAFNDASHIAIATIYGIKYFLTWNCKHIANAEIQKKIAEVSIANGYEIPIICTPYELMGG
jgi:predicted nucleic acid-binding protein